MIIRTTRPPTRKNSILYPRDADAITRAEETPARQLRPRRAWPKAPSTCRGPLPQFLDFDLPRIRKRWRGLDSLISVQDVPGANPGRDNAGVDQRSVDDLDVPSDIRRDKASDDLAGAISPPPAPPTDV